MTRTQFFSIISRCARRAIATIIFLAASILVFPVMAQEANSPAKKIQVAGSFHKEGQKLFESTCAACHGLDGRGGERGPDIDTRPEALRRSDEAILHILQNGLPAKGMPSFGSLGSAKLKALLAYVRNLQGIAKEAAIPGDPQRGKSLFFGKARCASCHMVHGAGGFLAADLTSYASSVSVAMIREAIIDPIKNLDPRATTVVATTRDGRKYTGIARNEDNFSLQLLSPDGTFHLFTKSDLQNLEYQPTSLMPEDYATILSHGELDDLISYLVSATRARKQAHREGEESGSEKEND